MGGKVRLKTNKKVIGSVKGNPKGGEMFLGGVGGFLSHIYFNSLGGGGGGGVQHLQQP